MGVSEGCVLRVGTHQGGLRVCPGGESKVLGGILRGFYGVCPGGGSKVLGGILRRALWGVSLNGSEGWYVLRVQLS